MEWISVKERLPQLSYVESDNQDDPYESNPVLLYSTEKCSCVGYLVMNQNEEDWNFEELSWECYLPHESITDIDFDKITHWVPLPQSPL